MDSSLITSVPVLSFVTIAIAMLFGVLIPLVLILVIKKKTNCKIAPFFAGCGTFFVFAIVLEGICHAIILGGGRAEAIMARPLLYALYGGVMAGLFEETGRFLVYKFLLKKYRDDDSTALAYGAGHGGFEAFYILIMGMITNIVFGILINIGKTDLILGTMDEASKAVAITQLASICNTNPLLFLVSIIERFGAVAFHMAASILVWFAVKNKKLWYLYPAAILLHAMLDMIAAFFNSIGSPIWIIEVMLYVFSALCILLACFIWKKEKKAEVIEA
ncbi:MAG: YhfC family intramembrane metalloprotease [Treponema sp.]|nr:YhfC family intramembrane metalloprotease [Treponema sp.]